MYNDIKKPPDRQHLNTKTATNTGRQADEQHHSLVYVCNWVYNNNNIDVYDLLVSIHLDACVKRRLLSFLWMKIRSTHALAANQTTPVHRNCCRRQLLPTVHRKSWLPPTGGSQKPLRSHRAPSETDGPAHAQRRPAIWMAWSVRARHFRSCNWPAAGDCRRARRRSWRSVCRTLRRRSWWQSPEGDDDQRRPLQRRKEGRRWPLTRSASSCVVCSSPTSCGYASEFHPSSSSEDDSPTQQYRAGQNLGLKKVFYILGFVDLILGFLGL